ncbi:MAG: hypothetical protein ACYC0V_00190 [Armatimonadota bacterium]
MKKKSNGDPNDTGKIVAVNNQVDSVPINKLEIDGSLFQPPRKPSKLPADKPYER